MSRFWSDAARKIEPYVPGEQPRDRKYIKLNTNENPYPPSPRVQQMLKEFGAGELRLYPDPDCNELKSAVAEYYGLEKQQIFAGNGSDELLAFSFMAFFNPGDTICYPDITYSFYPVYADLFKLRSRIIPLNDDFSLPVDRFVSENSSIIIANPNAPTGMAISANDIQKIVQADENRLVIVDEAYIDFGGETSVNLIKTCPNLLVIQTFSKSRALAGMRIGIALGSGELIEGLERIKNSFNSYTVDRLALRAATEAIKDREYFDKTRLRVMSTRERISLKLKQIGFIVTPSMANFIFISHPRVKAGVIFEKLKEEGILVRYFNKNRIDNYLRITIGTDDEMDRLVEVLENILEEHEGS